MIQAEAILSDLDGTLIDTTHLIRKGLYQTAYAYLEAENVAPNDLPTYGDFEPIVQSSVGGSARETLERIVRAMYPGDESRLGAIDFDKMHDMLNPVQDKLAPDVVKPYPGLDGLLLKLGETGMKLAIFTSGTQYHVVRNLGIALPNLGYQHLYKEHAGSNADKLNLISKRIREEYSLPGLAIVTCDDVRATKPDPEGINLAMKLLEVSPASSIALGDHSADMQAAFRANIPIRIGITHGFDEAAILKNAGATVTLDSLNDVAASLGKV